MIELAPEPPLQNAASHRDEERVRQLLADGADPDVPGPLGHTALHTAAARDVPGIARLLVEAGARVDPPDEAGNTPLLVAATVPKKPALGVVDVLLAARADPDAANRAGSTPRTLARARAIPSLRERFAALQDEGSAVDVPRIDVVVSTPSKLTLVVGSGQVTLSGEMIVLADGDTDRILVVHDLEHYDDGTPMPESYGPQILCYLTARSFLYDRGEGYRRQG